MHEEGVLIGLDADVRYRVGHKLVSARVVDLEIHLCGIREPCQLELTLSPQNACLLQKTTMQECRKRIRPEGHTYKEIKRNT